MGPYGSLLFFMHRYVSSWVLIGPYPSLSILLDFFASLCVLMGPYVSLCVLMDSSGSLWVLWVLIDPNAFLFVLIGSYRSAVI